MLSFRPKIDKGERNQEYRRIIHGLFRRTRAETK